VALHEVGVLESTDLTPSPLVTTTTEAPCPALAPVGSGLMRGVVGVARSTWNVCGVPDPAPKLVPWDTWAVREQVPRSRNLTLRPLAEQVAMVLDVTDLVPSPVVEIVALKVFPTAAVVGRLVIVGEEGGAEAPAPAGKDTIATPSTTPREKRRVAKRARRLDIR
jgi:hypothetical protein